MGETAIYGLTAAVLAGLITHVVCQLVMRLGVALDPVSERSNHRAPTPRLGGVGFLIGMTSAALVLLASGLLDRAGLELLLIVLGGGAIGFLDDVFGARAQLKLALMTILAFAAAWMIGPVQTVPLPLIGWVELGRGPGLLLGAFWVLSIMNVVNFMDGLNGLAGAFAVVVFTAISTVWLGPSWSLLAAQVAILGFLFCNVFEGRIFLGDAGSLSLGALIGAASLATAGQGSGFWLAPLVCLPLILDVAVTLIRRAIRGARLHEPHREHLYQQMKAAGWSHQAAAIAVVSSGAAGAGMACLLWPLARERPAVYWLCALLIGLVWAALMRAMLTLKQGRSGLEGTLR